MFHLFFEGVSAPMNGQYNLFKSKSNIMVGGEGEKEGFEQQFFFIRQLWPPPVK